MLELRTQENLFTQDYSKLHSLTTNLWIKMAWQFQMEHQIQIKTDLPPLSESRVKDQFLIKSFAQAGIQGTELARINQCWIYLKVMTLADIYDSAGIYILPDMWAGKNNQTFTLGYNWPNQGQLPKKIGYCGNWHSVKPFQWTTYYSLSNP